jgi:hypothetical protein
VNYCISKEFALKDYNDLKNFAAICVSKGKYEDAIKFITAASKIAYHLNFRLADDELEKLIKIISNFMIKPTTYRTTKNKIVFYDTFGLENRGLTQQYLNAFSMWDVDFLYILAGKTDSASGILADLSQYENADLVVLDTNKITCQEIYEKVVEFGAERIFIHISPFNVKDMVALSAIEKADKYLIDLTDHAYWLGKACSDYFIGFREYGAYISTYFRNIPPSKQIRQMFYPIFSKSIFLGFNVDVSNKKVIFSGGNYYKMYGKNNLFFEIIKRICIENSNVLVLIAGSGNSRPLIEFIKSEKLTGQVHLIGSRKDIGVVFEHIDIYLNTFPIMGGLMSQLAIKANKPLIGYTKADLPCNLAEGFFTSTNGVQLTYSELETFHHEINNLINDEIYYKEVVQKLRGLVTSQYHFSMDLRLKIETKKSVKKPPEDIGFDMEEFSSLYFDMENKYLKKYHQIKLSSIKLLYLRYSPKQFFVSLFWALKSKIEDRLFRY